MRNSSASRKASNPAKMPKVSGNQQVKGSMSKRFCKCSGSTTLGRHKENDEPEEDKATTFIDEENGEPDEEIVFIGTEQLDEEERQRRFGRVRKIRPYIPKPRLFFKSGPISYTVQKKSNAKTRCHSTRRPLESTRSLRPLLGNDVFIFRDDVEMVAAARPKKKNGPIYAGAYKELQEAFNLTFYGRPSTLTRSERVSERKKETRKRAEEKRKTRSTKSKSPKKRRVVCDRVEQSPSSLPGTPDSRGFLFGY